MKTSKNSILPLKSFFNEFFFPFFKNDCSRNNIYSLWMDLSVTREVVTLHVEQNAHRLPLYFLLKINENQVAFVCREIRPYKSLSNPSCASQISKYKWLHLRDGCLHLPRSHASVLTALSGVWQLLWPA